MHYAAHIIDNNNNPSIKSILLNKIWLWLHYLSYTILHIKMAFIHLVLIIIIIYFAIRFNVIYTYRFSYIEMGEI